MDAARPDAPVLVTVNGKGWEKMGWDDSLMPVLDAAGVTLAARSRIRHMVVEGVHAELLALRRRGGVVTPRPPPPPHIPVITG